MAKHRTLFISDVHLGTRSAKADLLLDFLERNEAETVYLVGDIVDFWRIGRGAVWPQSHSDVLQKLLAMVHAGTRVIYIPGNHDDGLRQYCGTRFGGVEILQDCVHTTADGRRYLVMHGDEYDVVVRYAQWLALVGDRGYSAAMLLNRPLNAVRRWFGLDYWSLSAYLKNRVKRAVNNIGDFEKALAQGAAERRAEGVICGHIHRAAILELDNIEYINCGDWVESCTAIAEGDSGQLEIIRWKDEVARRLESERRVGELNKAAA